MPPYKGKHFETYYSVNQYLTYSIIQKMRKFSTLLLGLLCLSLVFGACTRKALVINQFSDDDCPVSDSSSYYDSLLVASVQKMNIDTTNCQAKLTKRFSKRAIAIAENLGVKSLLCELQRLEDNKASELEILKIKQELQGRITVGLADINSSLSEMECQTIRTRELQLHLSDWIDTRLNRANTYAILSGGVSAIIAGLIATKVIKITEENDAANITEQSIGMTGAVIGTYYSFRAVAIHRKVAFNHPRNHIACVYENQNKNGLFSPFLWKFMTKTFVKDGKPTTGVQEILEKWHQLGIPTEKEEEDYQEKTKLFSSLGGEYEVDDLDNRIEMYDILREEISLINYDLKRLQQEILIGYKQ
ncbi:MAG: hypothetical protein EAZ95_06005 [Bacteroidetes bacterium]|nr:MAG: hypothetical protein EAZ95_06005 [Bacteroidota bacterium]